MLRKGHRAARPSWRGALCVINKSMNISYKLSVIILGMATLFIPFYGTDAITQNQIAAEVQIVCPDNFGNWYSGSGTIIDAKGTILTNRHVVSGQDGSIIKVCFIGLIYSIDQEPDFGTYDKPNLAEVKYYTTTNDMDAAVLYLNNPSNKTYSFVDIWKSDSDRLAFGDKLEVVGYPMIGGSTLTYTSGDFSGFGSQTDGTQNYIKASVPLEHGNSGGAAYSSGGEYIGIPTMVVAGTLNSLSYILSVNSIKKWLNTLLSGDSRQTTQEAPTVTETPEAVLQEDITAPNINNLELWGSIGLDCISVRGFSNDYLSWRDCSRKSGFAQDAKFSEDSFMLDLRLVKFHSGEGYWDELPDPDLKGIYAYIGTDVNIIPSKISDADFLDVSTLTRPWFVSYSSGKLSREGTYYVIMQAVDKSNNFSDRKIWQYKYSPIATDEVPEISKSDNMIRDVNLIDRLKGYILLQVESHGEAWYLDPVTAQRYYMKDGPTAYQMMRSFGLGISETDYEKIADGDATLKQRLKGRIILRVEEHGEAYWIDPKDLSVRYLQNGDEAYRIMRLYSLGITNADLEKIASGEMALK